MDGKMGQTDIIEQNRATLGKIRGKKEDITGRRKRQRKAGIKEEKVISI